MLVVRILLIVGFLAMIPKADARTPEGVKKRQSVSLRSLIRAIDFMYLQPQSYPWEFHHYQDIDRHLAAVYPQISEDKQTRLQKLRQGLFTHPELWQFRMEVLKVFEISWEPPITPNYRLGKTLYQSHCASCHGASGQGDGDMALRIPNTDLSLVGPEAQSRMFSHLVYNLLLTGLDSGLMVPYEPAMDKKSLWSIAFFTTSLVCQRGSQLFPASSLLHPFMKLLVPQGAVTDRQEDPRCLAPKSNRKTKS